MPIPRTQAEQPPAVSRHCHTCAKRFKATEQCHVLTEPIGQWGECFAWSDDEDWRAKADKSKRAYWNRQTCASR